MKKFLSFNLDAKIIKEIYSLIRLTAIYNKAGKFLKESEKNEKEITTVNSFTHLVSIFTDKINFKKLCKKLIRSLKKIVQRSSQNVSSTLSFMGSSSPVFNNCNSNYNMEDVLISCQYKNNIKDKNITDLKLFKNILLY